jgi:hypothetical protein
MAALSAHLALNYTRMQCDVSILRVKFCYVHNTAEIVLLVTRLELYPKVYFNVVQRRFNICYKYFL